VKSIFEFQKTVKLICQGYSSLNFKNKIGIKTHLNYGFSFIIIKKMIELFKMVYKVNYKKSEEAETSRNEKVKIFFKQNKGKDLEHCTVVWKCNKRNTERKTVT
jgi:hypothetical protein